MNTAVRVILLKHVIILLFWSIISNNKKAKIFKMTCRDLYNQNCSFFALISYYSCLTHFLQTRYSLQLLYHQMYVTLGVLFLVFLFSGTFFPISTWLTTLLSSALCSLITFIPANQLHPISYISPCPALFFSMVVKTLSPNLHFINLFLIFLPTRMVNLIKEKFYFLCSLPVSLETRAMVAM